MIGNKETLPYICSIEGNIGTGKSSLLKLLSARGFYTIHEPIDEYMQDNVPLVWEDMNRWTMTFDLEMIEWYQRLYIHNFDRKKALKDYETTFNMKIKYEGDNETISIKNKSDLIIVERSALSNREVFMKGFLETNLITEWEYSVYDRIFDLVSWKPKYIIYLSCDPKVSHQRINTRARAGEHGVQQSFLQSLHRRLEDLYNDENNISLGNDQKVFVIDVSEKNLDEVLKEVLSILEDLKSRVPDITEIDDDNYRDQTAKHNWVSCLCCGCFCDLF